uniref:Uncharacterized protein n=1 Tax=Oryza nivara TaxID=4536 RepID=A0A0E0G149_ORYNI
MEEGVDRALACTATAGREAGAAVLSEAEIRQLYVEVKRVLLSQPKCTTSCASTPPSRSAEPGEIIPSNLIRLSTI